ncbi:NAD(P)/FAD-dependent oxidoreductase [Synechococcus sp. BL107]|uniref:NAD(P)/FAD-dependent oxidoreductase n=1 Tax=Synechococcus sp. BL107 TaxID=313625 RepID=UPI00055F46D5|nr:NAD(P)/FAD-dependent oxidoreductase [Synechococcus sp. BL107]
MTDPDQLESVTATTESPSSSAPQPEAADCWNLVVIGGGAAGFMAAITAAEQGVQRVLVLESTPELLNKVRISGGGRCNVTHACWDPAEMIGHYPRGQRALKGMFSRFAAGDAIAWFADRGLVLIEEADGRMFPEQNRSEAVIQCLKQAALTAGVQVQTRVMVQRLSAQLEGGFLVDGRGLDQPLLAQKVMLATGGHPSGRKMAEHLGHQLVPPVPSLFSLSLNASALAACSGIAVDDVGLELKLNDQRFRQVGRVLITHRGLSGPATLRLSAFAARALHGSRYRGELRVDWSGGLGRSGVEQRLQQWRQVEARRTVAAAKPFDHLPRRLWQAFLKLAGVDGEGRWADFSAKAQRNLVEILCAQCLPIVGRGPFGEEFVTAGGVALGELNLATMESRRCPGLYIAGELLDVDGVTGGFNFQACWSGGWLAGQAIATAD